MKNGGGRARRQILSLNSVGSFGNRVNFVNVLGSGVFARSIAGERERDAKTEERLVDSEGESLIGASCTLGERGEDILWFGVVSLCCVCVLSKTQVLRDYRDIYLHKELLKTLK